MLHDLFICGITIFVALISIIFTKLLDHKIDKLNDRKKREINAKLLSAEISYCLKQLKVEAKVLNKYDSIDDSIMHIPYFIEINPNYFKMHYFTKYSNEIYLFNTKTISKLINFYSTIEGIKFRRDHSFRDSLTNEVQPKSFKKIYISGEAKLRDAAIKLGIDTLKALKSEGIDKKNKKRVKQNEGE